MENKNMTVGVAVITYKDKKHLERCLPPLLASPVKPRVVVFNTDNDDEGKQKPTNDGTAAEAERLGAEVHLYPRSKMNHGVVREYARKFLNTDIVILMTPDAYPQDEHMVEKLIKPIVEGKASVAYARQVPRPNANAFVKFGNGFRYPAQSNIRGIEDAPKYGSMTAFCSNACCAWLNSALDEIGGFQWILTAEDSVAGAMLIKAGHKIAYVAEAVVEHSHEFGPKKEFIRHFDTGMHRSKRRWGKVLDMGTGSDEKTGMRFAKEALGKVWQKNPKLVPRVFAQLFMGWLGYRVGGVVSMFTSDEAYKDIARIRVTDTVPTRDYK